MLAISLVNFDIFRSVCLPSLLVNMYQHCPKYIFIQFNTSNTAPSLLKRSLNVKTSQSYLHLRSVVIMRPTTSRPVTSRIGNTANANIAARLGPVRVPVRAPFVGNGRPGAANVPRVLGPRGTNVNNAENAQNPPVRQPEQDQRTTLTGAGTWEYQTPAFDPEGEVRIRELVNLICEYPIDDYLYSRILAHWTRTSRLLLRFQ